MKVESALTELESLLPGMNYVVSFDLHRVSATPGGTPEEFVAAALGPDAVVGRTAEVSATEMLAEVEQCIRWEGEEGSYPDEAAIHSPRLDELVACVLDHLRSVAARCTALWSFRLKVGHPHYPVQWEFAYVMVGSGGAEVFIGSSSD